MEMEIRVFEQIIQQITSNLGCAVTHKILFYAYG